MNKRNLSFLRPFNLCQTPSLAYGRVLARTFPGITIIIFPTIVLLVAIIKLLEFFLTLKNLLPLDHNRLLVKLEKEQGTEA